MEHAATACAMVSNVAIMGVVLGLEALPTIVTTTTAMAITRRTGLVRGATTTRITTTTPTCHAVRDEILDMTTIGTTATNAKVAHEARREASAITTTTMVADILEAHVSSAVQVLVAQPRCPTTPSALVVRKAL